MNGTAQAVGPRVLVLGGSGLLGRSLLRHAPPHVELLAPDQPDLPLEEQERLSRYLRDQAVDRLLCLAAWTHVDGCESDPELAFRVNGILPGRVASMADRLGIPILFMSTDYVFDGDFGGDAPAPYREYDPARPLSVYGRSKWYGECAVREASRSACIVRSAGLYGRGGPNFVDAVLARLRTGPVDVVTDEVNTPVFVEDLAPALWKLALADEPGVWHLTPAGAASRFEQARRIAQLGGFDPDLVRPTTRARLGRAARRPPYSVLNCQAVREVFGFALPSWEEGLERYLGTSGAGGRSASEGAPTGGPVL